jgi:hypothetical protein
MHRQKLKREQVEYIIQLWQHHNLTSWKMLRKGKTVFVVTPSGIDGGVVAAAAESWRLARRASPAGRWWGKTGGHCLLTDGKPTVFPHHLPAGEARLASLQLSAAAATTPPSIPLGVTTKTVFPLRSIFQLVFFFLSGSQLQTLCVPWINAIIFYVKLLATVCWEWKPRLWNRTQRAGLCVKPPINNINGKSCDCWEWKP